MKKFLLLAVVLLWSSHAWLQLSGTYTINPSGAAGGTNYQTFNAFASDLSNQGVNGAVTVNVKEGTYTESVTFGTHNGASAMNLVTIQADPANTNPVLLTYASTSTNHDEATIILAGTEYLRIDGLNIENTGSNYSHVISIPTGCNDIEISNNKIEGPNNMNGGIGSFLIYGYSVSAGNLSFNNNNFVNGRGVIRLSGTSNSRIGKLEFKNNEASGILHYGLLCFKLDTLIVHNNVFRQMSSSNFFYGIQSNNHSSSHGAYTSILGNEIYASTSSGVYGIFLHYFSHSGSRGQIINNMITNIGNGTQNRYGIYLRANSNIDIWHNTVSFSDGNPNWGAPIFFEADNSTNLTYSQGGYDVRNNIFSNTVGGYAMVTTGAAANHLNVLNYNIYHTNGANLFYVNNTNYSDLASWQVASSLDSNSLTGDPLFVNDDDLHVFGDLADNVGDNTLGVGIDIDGDIRPMAPSTTVDIGADEFIADNCLPVSDLSITNMTMSSADLSWSPMGNETAWNIELVVSGSTPVGTGANVTTNPYTYTGLSMNTYYDVYIQADCGGDYSRWRGPYTFRTSCAPVVAPWMENLDGNNTPSCWSQSSISGGPWEFDADPSYDAANVVDHTSGSGNFAYVDFFGTDESVILQTPDVDISALTVAELRFWLWSHASQSPNFYNIIYVEAYDGSQWKELRVIQGDLGPNWTEYRVVIPTSYYKSADIVELRFRAESGGSNLDYYNDILLDDISVVEGPSCQGVFNTQLLNSDATTAEVNWLEAGNASEWKVEYGALGFTPGTGTFVTTTTKPVTIQGLASKEYYEVFVYSICGSGDTSAAFGPISFNTYNQAEYMEAGTDCGPGFIDISQTGTDLGLGNNDEASYILPFPWLVEGEMVDRIVVGNNGGVLLNTLVGNVSWGLPSEDGFYPFVANWESDTNGVQVPGVFWEVLGTAPNRQYVIMWKDRFRYPWVDNPNPCTFEMIYDEATSEVWYSYPDTDFGNPDHDYGASAEIGFRGNHDITISVDDPQYLMENQCLHLYYTNCPKPSDLETTNVSFDEVTFTWSAGLANETQWLIKYGFAGFDPQTGGTSQTSASNQFVLSGLVEDTEYDICIYALCDSGDTSKNVCASFKTSKRCPDVTGLNGETGVDSLMLAWNWQESSLLYQATGFDTYYGQHTYDPSIGGWTYNGDTTNNMDTIVNIGLMAGGVYDVYVQAVCDSIKSNLVGPITLLMPLTNDSISGAEPLSIDGNPYIFHNHGATVEAWEPAIAPPVTGSQQTDGWKNNEIEYSTWFRFNAPNNGQIRVSGMDIEFDGQFAIYELVDSSESGILNFIAANDDAIGGTSKAPNFTFCGLEPGKEYHLMHEVADSASTGIYSIRLNQTDSVSGISAGVLEMCSLDTLSLFEGIDGDVSGGVWIDLQNDSLILNDSLFAPNGLAGKIYEFEYRVEDGCAVDSVVVQVDVYIPLSAGEDGTITICKNQPAELVSALEGIVHAGGTWFNSDNEALPNDSIASGAMGEAGEYTYRYIVGEGVCPEDTSKVTLIVDGTCDYLNTKDLIHHSLKIYPNPNKGLVKVEYPEMEKLKNVSVVDSRGRILDAPIQRTENGMQIDLRLEVNGIYVLKLEGENYTIFKRIVKQ